MEAPYIRLEKNLILVAEGDSAALVCQATGIPSPTITWYKDGNDVSQSLLDAAVNTHVGHRVFM